MQTSSPREAGVVFGGSSGLGAATAAMLRDSGLEVLSVSTSGTRGSLRCDVRNRDEVLAAMAGAFGNGAPRVVVNCAGIFEPGLVWNPMSKLSQTMVETLVYGGFNVLSCVGELVAASGTQQSDLVVVLTSSVAALSGQRGQLLYAAGHSAVEGMVVPAARELGKFGVRVVALRAGAFDTRMFRALREEVKRRVLSDSGMVAPLKPRDFARTVAWVMETRAVNGCVIPVDGGMRL